MDEPRLTFVVREAPIMPPFRLEHNYSVSKFMFMLSNHDFSQLMSRWVGDSVVLPFRWNGTLCNVNVACGASCKVTQGFVLMKIDRNPIFL